MVLVGIFRVKAELTGIYYLQNETEAYQQSLAMNEIGNIPEMLSILLYVNSY